MMTGTQLDSRSTNHEPPRLLTRILGMLRLEPRMAREIARSPEAFGEACIVALLVAFAGMVSAPAGGLGAVLHELIQAFGLWILSALLVAFFAPALLGTPTTSLPNINATLRLFGYAQAPLMLGFVGVIGPFAGLASAVGWVLMIVTTAFAVRQLTHLSWTRALIAAVGSRLVAAIPIGIIGFLLHTSDRIFGAIF